jgi:hypothetical protein
MLLTATALIGIGLPAISAQAALVISSKATQNVSCSGGVCTATRNYAVMNAGDLASMLGSSDVTLQSTSRAMDIEVKAPLSWASASRLTLDSYRALIFYKPLTVAGPGALTLTTNDGGSGGELSFEMPGRAVFWDLSSSLVIDGASYTLVGDIATLASDIAADASGHYALANNYNASVDGTYTTVPIPTQFTGTLNGLGNTISKLNIDDSVDQIVGLFADIAGTVQWFGVVNAHVRATRSFVAAVGAVAGILEGSIVGVSATGTVYGPNSTDAGGLVGDFVGAAEIRTSYSTASVRGGGSAGGLAGAGYGAVSGCFATGAATAAYAGGLVGYFGFSGAGEVSTSFSTGGATSTRFSRSSETSAGGLVGANEGTILNSYSTGGAFVKRPVSNASSAGGLVGHNYSVGSISSSYSTGAASGAATSVGGSIGTDDGADGSLIDTYWDIDTSGIANLGRGAGNRNNDPGITGLTTAQLQSGLPAGFDSTIWGEISNINGGLPYLLANPPPLQ